MTNVVAFPKRLTGYDLNYYPVAQAEFLRQCQKVLSDGDFDELLDALNDFDAYVDADKDIRLLVNIFSELL